MGESYLQTKLLGRIKKLRTNNSNSDCNLNNNEQQQQGTITTRMVHSSSILNDQHSSFSSGTQRTTLEHEEQRENEHQGKEEQEIDDKEKKVELKESGSSSTGESVMNQQTSFRPIVEAAMVNGENCSTSIPTPSVYDDFSAKEEVNSEGETEIEFHANESEQEKLVSGLDGEKSTYDDQLIHTDSIDNYQLEQGAIRESPDFSSSFTSNDTANLGPETETVTNDSSLTTNDSSSLPGRGRRKSLSFAALATALKRPIKSTTSQVAGQGATTQQQPVETAVKTRLKSATKAIFFFRRAASSLTHRHNHHHEHQRHDNNHSRGGGGLSHSISGYSTHAMAAGAHVVRQSTADSSHSGGGVSQMSFGGGSGGQLNNTNNLNGCPPSSIQADFPRFIVPRMNGLRLPLVCLIKSLDGELMREVFVHRYELGEYLIESLKVSLGVNDCKYFGLKLARSVEDQEDLHNPWLDLNESVCKQIKNKVNSQILAQQHQHQLLQQQQQQRSDSSISQAQSSFSPPAPPSSGSNEPTCSTTATTSTTTATTVVGGSHSAGPQTTNGTFRHTGSSSPAASCSSSTSARSIEFYLRIKFYPPNLARVQDAFLRNYLWLQLRRDLRQGKLTSSMNNLTLLMACVLQYEFGDYREEEAQTLREQKLPYLNILPNQDLIEEQAIGMWRSKLRGLRPHQAQMQFLRAAVILETYGFDYYPVRDHQRQRAYLLGFNYAGIKTIRNGRIVHHFRWHSLSKISYERRMIIFHIYSGDNSKRKQILGFKCLSNDDCQSLYMRLLEQKYFFTVDLAYFDKSIRRPSCLFTTSASSYDWSSATANNNNNVAVGAKIHHQQIEQLPPTGNNHGNQRHMEEAQNEFSRSFSSRSVDEIEMEQDEFDEDHYQQQFQQQYHNQQHSKWQQCDSDNTNLPALEGSQQPHHSKGFMATPNNQSEWTTAAAAAAPTTSSRPPRDFDATSSTSCLIKSIKPQQQQQQQQHLQKSCMCGSSNESGCSCFYPTVVPNSSSTSNLEAHNRLNSFNLQHSCNMAPHRSYQLPQQTSKLERQQSTIQYCGTMPAVPSCPSGLEAEGTHKRAWNNKPNEQLEWASLTTNEAAAAAVAYDNWTTDEISSLTSSQPLHCSIPGEHSSATTTMAKTSVCDNNINNETWNRPRTNQGFSNAHRLLEVIESILIQPATTLLPQTGTLNSSSYSHNNINNINSHNQSQSQLSLFRSTILYPAIRFCVLILIMNFILRLTDSFSSAVVDILTLSSTATPMTATGSPATAATVAGLDQQDLLTFLQL